MGELQFKRSSKVTFLQFYSSSWYCLINTNMTKILSMFSLWTVSAQQAPLPFPVKTVSTQDQESLSAPSSDCLCQARASSWSGGSVETHDFPPYPGFVSPEYFMETSRSAVALGSSKYKKCSNSLSNAIAAKFTLYLARRRKPV